MSRSSDEVVPASPWVRIGLAITWMVGWAVVSWVGGSKGLAGLVTGESRQRLLNDDGEIVFDETYTGLQAVFFSLNEFVIALCLLVVAIFGARLIYLGDRRHLLSNWQHRSLVGAAIMALIGLFVLLLPALLHGFEVA